MPDYLAVKDWKDELKLHKIAKDGGLGEALTDWSKVKGKDIEDQLESLEEVEKKAGVAAKLFKGNKDLLKYIASVSATAEDEARKLESAAEGSEDDAKDKLLYAALKRAKTARLFFAAVVKGSTDGHLLMSKMKVKPTDIGGAKKELGGGRVFRGMCFVENGKHIFELKKEPPATLAKLLKKIAKLQAGLMIRAECRLAQFEDDLGEEDDDERDESESTETGGEDSGAVDFAKLRSVWGGVQQRAAADLSKVRQAILDEFKGEPYIDRVTSAVGELSAALTVFNGELEGALDRAAKAGSSALETHLNDAREIVSRYRLHLNGNEWMQKIDQNPFMPVSVRGSLEKALSALEKQLQR